LERKWTVDDAKIQHDKMRKFYFIYNNLQDEIKAAWCWKWRLITIPSSMVIWVCLVWTKLQQSKNTHKGVSPSPQKLVIYAEYRTRTSWHNCY